MCARRRVPGSRDPSFTISPLTHTSEPPREKRSPPSPPTGFPRDEERKGDSTPEGPRGARDGRLSRSLLNFKGRNESRPAYHHPVLGESRRIQLTPFSLPPLPLPPSTLSASPISLSLTPRPRLTRRVIAILATCPGLVLNSFARSRRIDRRHRDAGDSGPRSRQFSSLFFFLYSL